MRDNGDVATLNRKSKRGNDHSAGQGPPPGDGDCPSGLAESQPDQADSACSGPGRKWGTPRNKEAMRGKEELRGAFSNSGKWRAKVRSTTSDLLRGALRIVLARLRGSRRGTHSALSSARRLAVRVLKSRGLVTSQLGSVGAESAVRGLGAMQSFGSGGF